MSTQTRIQGLCYTVSVHTHTISSISRHTKTNPGNGAAASLVQANAQHVVLRVQCVVLHVQCVVLLVWMMLLLCSWLVPW
jgi:hypothetical protein